MANRKGGIRSITDKDLVTLINKRLSAQEICERAGISLPALQRRIGEIMQRYQKYVHVPGLYAKTGHIRFSGMGIVIDSPFEAGDELCIEVGEDCTINWTGNIIRVMKIGEPREERPIEKTANKITAIKEKKAPEAAPQKRLPSREEDLESLDDLFENL